MSSSSHSLNSASSVASLSSSLLVASSSSLSTSLSASSLSPFQLRLAATSFIPTIPSISFQPSSSTSVLPSVLLWNVHGFSRAKSVLWQYLHFNAQPAFICLTETHMDSGVPPPPPPNYSVGHFFSRNSGGGGVVIFVRDGISFSVSSLSFPSSSIEWAGICIHPSASLHLDSDTNLFVCYRCPSPPRLAQRTDFANFLRSCRGFALSASAIPTILAGDWNVRSLFDGDSAENLFRLSVGSSCSMSCSFPSFPTYPYAASTPDGFLSSPSVSPFHIRAAGGLLAYSSASSDHVAILADLLPSSAPISLPPPLSRLRFRAADDSRCDWDGFRNYLSGSNLSSLDRELSRLIMLGSSAPTSSWDNLVSSVSQLLFNAGSFYIGFSKPVSTRSSVAYCSDSSRSASSPSVLLPDLHFLSAQIASSPAVDAALQRQWDEKLSQFIAASGAEEVRSAQLLESMMQKGSRRAQRRFHAYYFRSKARRFDPNV